MFSKKKIIIAFVVCASMFAHFAYADATIQVNSTADTFVVDGQCTLREAAANADFAGVDQTGGDCDPGSATGVDTITFSGPLTIVLTDDIIIHSPVYLDGITGGNGVCATKELGVIISGGYFIDLGTESSGSTIRGFDIQGGGIRVQESSGTKIQCNMIGLDATGLTAVGGLGVTIFGGSNHLVGGSAEGDGNVVSGNNSDISGISFQGGDGFVIKGNIIGLDKNGDVAMLTQNGGMNITGDVTNLTIGGPGAFERNIISGNYGGAYTHGIIFLNGTMSNITIQNNYVGTDITGMFARPNKNSGFDFCDDVGCPGTVFNVSDILIGGPGANEGNIFSGNEHDGISLKGVNNFTLQGNYFGLNALGTGIISNGRDALEAERDRDGVIGGVTASTRNYFAGEGDGTRGIHILKHVFDPEITFLSVIGNYVGLDISGNPIGGFTEAGIRVQSEDLSDIIIGGTGAGEGNVVAGAIAGISIAGDGLRVFGNKIGTDPLGNTAAGYGNEIGIQISSAGDTHEFVGSHNKIGGVNPGESNIIAGNSIGVGIIVVPLAEVDEFAQTGNSILGNSIFGNNKNGIDLFYFDGMTDPVLGSTPNDVGDADTGPNNLLNHPVINSVNTTTGDVAYTLDVPAGSYRIEFYKNPTSGTYGEGEVFLDYDTFISTGSSKQQTKTLSLTSGDYVTASATECTDNTCTAFLSTSEFSQAYEPITIPAPNPINRVSPTNGGCPNDWITPTGCKMPISLPINSKDISPATICPAFIHFYRKGDKNEEIKLIQSFLNKELNLKLPVDGSYGLKTEQAVRKFQVKYSKDILEPWHPPFAVKSTGRWYKTTTMKANQLKGCISSEVILEDNGRVWKL